jgi:hypothetical protein
VTPWSLYVYPKKNLTEDCTQKDIFDILTHPESLLKEQKNKLSQLVNLETYSKGLAKNPENILSELLMAVIYLKMENQNGAEFLIRKSLFRDPQSALLNQCIISQKKWSTNQKEISQGISQMLSYIKLNLKNKLLAEMLIRYFMLYSNVSINKAIAPLSEMDTSKSNIEKELKGVKEGKAFFPFWFFLLFDQISENEKYDLANKYFDPFLIRNYFENVGWVLEYYFPLGEDLRKTIFSSAESLSKQKSAKSLNLWLRLLNQKTIKSELEKQDAEIAKPLFNIQRKTYSELLKNKQACSYSFYSLLKLGDEQKIYLDQLNSCLD